MNRETRYNLDGTVTFFDGERTKTVPRADVVAESLAFFGPGPVPEAIEPAQGEVMLLRLGLLDQLRQLINAPGADPEWAIWFNRAKIWRRDSTAIVAVGAALGLSPAAIDDMFRAAAEL
jgi:hypothetical protein